MEKYPIGSLELKSMVPAGIFVALLLENPNSEISFSPREMNFDLSTDKSLGVIHAMP